MPTFDPSTFGLPTYTEQASSSTVLFGVLALLFDLVFVLAVVREAVERDSNPLAWGLLTLFVPFIGYLIWKASISRDDNPPDMSIILRERRGGTRSDAGSAAPPRRSIQRPRNFF